MKTRSGRLRAALFLCLALCAFTCQPARAQAPTRLYYTTAGGPRDPGGLIGSGLTRAELEACGFDAILTAGDWDLRYRWLTERLTPEAVRASLAPMVAAADGMPVWLELGSTCWGGSPTPAAPFHTFYDPRDLAHRARSLDNLALIGQVCAELGIRRVGFDLEPYGVTDPRQLYPSTKARPLGVDLAKALLRDNPTLDLFAFCPVSFYTGTAGFRPLVRGLSGQAGRTFVLFNEDAYGMQGNVPRLLQRAKAYTQARNVAAGWYASDRAADGAGWLYRCAPQLQAAVKACPFLMVFRAGPPLWRDRPDIRDAAGAVLRSLIGP